LRAVPRHDDLATVGVLEYIVRAAADMHPAFALKVKQSAQV
jgi:hypothetical protein